MKHCNKARLRVISDAETGEQADRNLGHCNRILQGAAQRNDWGPDEVPDLTPDPPCQLSRL